MALYSRLGPQCSKRSFGGRRGGKLACGGMTHERWQAFLVVKKPPVRQRLPCRRCRKSPRAARLAPSHLKMVRRVRSTLDSVAKLFEEQHASNNWTGTSESLIQYCALATGLESMLRLPTLKIILQHIPLDSRHKRAAAALPTRAGADIDRCDHRHHSD